MPGLTEEEYERYRELMEIRCLYEKNGNALFFWMEGTMVEEVAVILQEQVFL